jgi:hypothetical protein
MKRSIATFFLVFATALALGIVPKAQAGEPKECSNAILHHSFAYTGEGTILPAAAPPPLSGPFGEIGRQTFDGKGNTEATATASFNGNILKLTIVGTYTVNPDCTGSMTFNVSPAGITGHADFVIGDDGDEIRTVDTDAGTIETRVYRKQFQGSPEQR